MGWWLTIPEQDVAPPLRPFLEHLGFDLCKGVFFTGTYARERMEQAIQAGRHLTKELVPGALYQGKGVLTAEMKP